MDPLLFPLCGDCESGAGSSPALDLDRGKTKA